MPTDELLIGLRFRRGDARILRNLATDLRSRRPPGIDIGLYDKAAESAERNEPLLVRCSHPLEAQHMAAGFSHLGMRAPTIEELDGTPQGQ